MNAAFDAESGVIDTHDGFALEKLFYFKESQSIHVCRLERKHVPLPKQVQGFHSQEGQQQLARQAMLCIANALH